MSKQYSTVGCDIAPTHSAFVSLVGRPDDYDIDNVIAVTSRRSDQKLRRPNLNIVVYPTAEINLLPLEQKENVQIEFTRQLVVYANAASRSPELLVIEGWPYKVDRGAHQSGAASALVRALLFPASPRRLHDVLAVKIAATGTSQHPKGTSKDAVAAGVLQLDHRMADYAKLHPSTREDVYDAFVLALLGLYELVARETGIDPEWPEPIRRVLLRSTNCYPEAAISRELITTQAVLARIIEASG